MPIRGDDAGNNLGTGGDFTVYSGPFTGARGGSEFWARSAKFGGSGTSYLRKTALSGVSDSNTVTLILAFRTDTNTNDRVLFEIGDDPDNNNYGVYIYLSGGTTLEVRIRNSAGSIMLDSGEYSLDSTLNKQHILMLSFSSTVPHAVMYTDGTQSFDTASITNASTVLLASTKIRIGGSESTTKNDHDGDVGFFYFDDSYIDFSQESNRNLFVDQLGYPKDLQKQIDDGLIANPLVYMPFDDTSALGTNAGTGGNFSVNGSVTSGSDVNP